MEYRKLSKAEFLLIWEEEKRRKMREVQRLQRFLTQRHNDERIRKVVKKRRPR